MPEVYIASIIILATILITPLCMEAHSAAATVMLSTFSAAVNNVCSEKCCLAALLPFRFDEQRT